MKLRPRTATVSLIVLAAAILMHVDGWNHQAHLQEGGGMIYPDVLDALQQQPEAEVMINLARPGGPISSLTLSELEQSVAERQTSVLADLTQADFTPTHQYRVSFALAGRITASGVEKLQGHPDVVSVSLDVEVFATLAESVPLINADQVHLANVDGTGVDVAVIDSGIDSQSQDLADSILAEVCVLGPGECPGAPTHPAQDDYGHGTHVSGIITSNGVLAPRGAAPGARILAIKALNSNGGTSTSELLEALDVVVQYNLSLSLENIEVLNMSVGGSSFGQGQCLQGQEEISEDLAQLRTQGTVIFASAGNNTSKSGIAWPACDPSVISVGATYDAALPLGPPGFGCTDAAIAPDQVACWSQSSPDLDMLAPGSETLSDWPNVYGVLVLSGTSQSTPHAVGVAALLKQALPGLTPQQIEDRMKSTGKLVTDDLFDGNPATNRTTPRIDARVALLTNDNADYDLDGCTNGREFQTIAGTQTSGGIRNPLDFYDFFDVWTHPAEMPAVWERTKTVLLNDINAIAARFATQGDPNGNPLIPPTSDTGYHPAYDRRAALPGANPWDTRIGDGAIGLTDVNLAGLQFAHNCV